MQAPMSSLRIADRTFASRLLTGTGKYASAAQLRAVLDASGAEVVTMAIKRVRFGAKDDDEWTGASFCLLRVWRKGPTPA